MKIRMKHDNCSCWKQGQVFEVKCDSYGDAYIYCNAGDGKTHHWLNRNDLSLIRYDYMRETDQFEIVPDA